MILSLLGVTALADVDLGISQDMSTSSFRFDASHFLFEVPIKNEFGEFSVGVTIPFAFWDSYGLTTLNFTKVDTIERLKATDITVGIGYPIHFGSFTLRGELRASTPNWTDFKQWEYTPLLSIGFNFDSLLPDTTG